MVCVLIVQTQNSSFNQLTNNGKNNNTVTTKTFIYRSCKQDQGNRIQKRFCKT